MIITTKRIDLGVDECKDHVIEILSLRILRLVSINLHFTSKETQFDFSGFSQGFSKQARYPFSFFRFIKFPTNMLNIFRYILIQRKSIFILFLLLLINLWIYHLFQQSEVKLSRSLPLIVLYTFNRSIKTQENICRGAKNGGHVVNFDHCPKKCQFSCRMEDFQKRSPEAVLFFGEDFYWPLKLTDQQRTSPNQRWIFWSWEAPIHHPEYTKSGLTFNWYS